MVEECKFGNVTENLNNNGAYERNLACYLHFKFIVTLAVQTTQSLHRILFNYQLLSELYL